MRDRWPFGDHPRGRADRGDLRFGRPGGLCPSMAS